MKYKQLAKSTKGLSIRWSDNLFPNYRKNMSGPKVSKKRIKRCVKIVELMLDENRNRITKTFYEFAKKKFYNKSVKVEVDIDSAIDAVNNTILHTDDDALYGESDGITIWISSIKMSDEELVGTILHESLHNICTINNKEMCEKDEHAVMRQLGDNC